MSSAMDDQVRYVGQYLIGDTLGKGGYSWVKHGTDKKTNEVVALKFMARAEQAWEQEQASQVRTEIKSMIKIKSEYVMKLYAYNLNAKYPQKDGTHLSCILLVLEFCPGGELFDILYYCQQLDEVTARTYFQQMIQGLEDCHKHGVIHRDIKPQNLLMDANYKLKITDFGLSKLLSSDNINQKMSTSYVGTRGFQAPALLKKQQYTRACDIFSAGVVLFILLTGYPPFNHARKEDPWYKPLTKSNPEQFWKQHKGCGVPEACKDLIVRMLCYKPNKRITIDEIKKHKWFNGEIHTPESLKMTLKAKHSKAREKRKKDKRKIEENLNSVKKKRGKQTSSRWSDQPTLASLAVEYAKILEKWDEPPELRSASLHSWEVPKMLRGKKVKPEKALIEVEDYFINVWESALVTARDEDEQWMLRVKFADTNMRTFIIKMNVYSTEDSYIYTFNKLQGESLQWHKIWSEIEFYLIKKEIFPTDCTDDEVWYEDEKDDGLSENKTAKPDSFQGSMKSPELDSYKDACKSPEELYSEERDVKTAF